MKGGNADYGCEFLRLLKMVLLCRQLAEREVG
uniref:Kelch repeat and BTB domain containing 4 n=1 Tax=Homo sapiens TaxID=9606 RepID=E9PSA4_HUMAN